MESYAISCQRPDCFFSALTKNGFSLIELMVTLAVSAIILIFVVPSFQTSLMNSRISAVSDALYDALNVTRLTALSQNSPVKICPMASLGSTSCGSSWTPGWIIITQPTSGSPVLLQSYQIKSSGPVLSTNSTGITVDARGLTTNPINFKICDSRGASFARSLMMLATGFIQSGATAGQAVWDGSALTCP